VTSPALPEPSPLERWVGEDSWLVEVLLPRTDAGVLAQGVVVLAVLAALWLPARRVGLLQLWWGGAAFTAGLFALRATH